MPDFEVTIEFEVFCTCGAGLCGGSTGHTPGRGQAFVEVEPCETCLKEEYDKGHDEGYKDGFGEPG
ncbi:hypothetical protein LCGC14_2220850 [marine sediment metagenome]|uniref:Uncharacterized protein n=1 Tax=marine sediment metagenome TaxID=412755 RepID=A0A0F9FNK2_9ZZZZ